MEPNEMNFFKQLLSGFIEFCVEFIEIVVYRKNPMIWAFMVISAMIFGIWTLVVYLVIYLMNKWTQFLLVIALFMLLVQKDDGFGIIMGLMFLTVISIVVIDAILYMMDIS